jgi:hypothetical protein
MNYLDDGTAPGGFEFEGSRAGWLSSPKMSKLVSLTMGKIKMLRDVVILYTREQTHDIKIQSQFLSCVPNTILIVNCHEMSSRFSLRFKLYN